MGTKVCKICNIEKDINEFQKIREGNYRNDCKKCHSNSLKEYRHEYYLKNKGKIKKANKKWNLTHKTGVKEYNRNYYKANADVIINNAKKYRNNNKSYIVSKQIEYNDKRIKNDSLFRLKVNIRNMINRSFTRKRYQKNKHTEEIIGCDIHFFIQYLLQTYKDNYGTEWDGIEKVHIDHKKPLKYANTEEEVMLLCNYKNLQLLKAKDNLEKNAKLYYELKGE